MSTAPPGDPQTGQVIGAAGIASAEAVTTPTTLKFFPHWQYFLALESDLGATTRYVEPVRDNFRSYSIEFARILLSAGSEVDVVAKALCRQIDASSNARNVVHYREKIRSSYPRFPTMRVVVPRFGFLFEPWREWENEEAPSWWRHHNNVKHERATHFRDANLDNAFHAVAGLFCLVLYLYQRALYANELQPWTRLFKLEQEPGHLLLAKGFELPDFPRK